MGKGYEPAETVPAKFHGTSAFQIETGEPVKKKVKADYTDVFSSMIRKIGQEDPDVVTITAAMADGTAEAFPERVPGSLFLTWGLPRNMQ